jgi:hypothetical protein
VGRRQVLVLGLQHVLRYLIRELTDVLRVMQVGMIDLVGMLPGHLHRSSRPEV